MTTYQDQPLSRRQIREREAEAARAAEAAAESASVSETSALETPGEQEVPTGSTGRDSESAESSPSAEPLGYVTQGRAPLPHYEAPESAPSSPPEIAQGAEAGFRYRDFSPEGRRAARSNLPPAESADLDYRTQNRPDPGASAPPVASVPPLASVPPVTFVSPLASVPPVAPVPGASSPAVPMTRRELRALREAQEREQQASQPPVAAESAFSAASAPPVTAEPAVPAASVPPVMPEPAVPAASAPPVMPESAVFSASVPPQFPPAPTVTTPPPLVEPQEPNTDAVASLEAFFRAQSGAVPVISQGEPATEAEPDLAPDSELTPPSFPWQQAAPSAAAEPIAAEPIAAEEVATEDDKHAPFAVVSEEPEPGSEKPEPGADESEQRDRDRGEAAPDEAVLVEPELVDPVLVDPVPFESLTSEPAVAEPDREAVVLPPWGGLTPGGGLGESTPPVLTPPPLSVALGGETDSVTPSLSQTVSAPPAVDSAWAVPTLDKSTVEEAAVEAPAEGGLVADEAAVDSWAADESSADESAHLTSNIDRFAPAPVDSTSSQPPVGERPRNHWSRQAELDDEAQPATGSLTRDVGVGSATANALVLPEVPNPDIIVSPVRSTGDILVTGSISLPASLASTGALPAQLDESDLDNLLDPGDQQVVSTDSQPVRAVRAVSTHTSSREIIGATKPKRGNRALTTLIVAAAGMAVVVVTLLVVAIMQGVLN